MQTMKGVSFLNWQPSADTPKTTVLVSGPPRSGTSLVAATLHAAGLHMGYCLSDAVYEDLALAGMIATNAPRLRPLQLAGTDRNQWELGLRGVDVGALRSEIGRRNNVLSRWGVKRPNLVLSLQEEGIRLFRHPRLIIVLRDPVVVAERIKLTECVRAVEAVNYVKWSISAHLKAIDRLNCPVMLVSYEHAAGNQQRFRELLFAFCGLKVDAAEHSVIDQAVTQAKHRYQALAGAPIVRFPGRRRIGGSLERAMLQILADGKPLLRRNANRFRGSRRCRLDDARLGFEVDLRPYALPDSSLIQSVVSSTGDELTKSDRTAQGLGSLA